MKLIHAIAAVLLLLLLIPSVSALIDSDDVLVVSSYHSSHGRTEALLPGIFDVFSESGERISHIEYLDVLRFPSPEYPDAAAEYLRQKYGNGRFALVIAVDDDALAFVIKYYDTLYKGAYVVFSEINYVPDEVLQHPEIYTGAARQVPFSEMVDFARRASPSEIKNLYLITEDTLTGREYIEEMNKYLAVHPEMNGTLNSETGMDGLVKKLSELSDDTLVLFAMFNADSQGSKYDGSEDVLTIAASESSVPIMGFVDVIKNSQGDSIIGAFAADTYRHARLAGEYALRIMNGTSPQEIPYLEDAYAYPLLNNDGLKRFGWDVAPLSENAVIYNLENRSIELPDFYYKMLLLLSAAGIIASFAIGMQYAAAEKRRNTLKIIERRIDVALESAGCGVWTMNFDKNTLKIDKTCMEFIGISGSDSAEISFDSIMEFVHPDDMIKVDMLYADMRSNSRDGYATTILRLRAKDGTYRPITVTCGFLYSANKIEKSIGIFNDISERVHTREKVRTTNRKISVLSSIAKRDIFGKIYVLSEYAKTIKGAPVFSETEADAIKRISSNVVNLEKQINFSKRLADEGLSDKKWISLRSAIMDNYDDNHLSPLMITIYTGSLEIYADDLFVDVLSKMLKNSIEYGKYTSAVRIRYEKTDNGSIRLIYEDNGCGISPEARNEIFTEARGRIADFNSYICRMFLNFNNMDIEEVDTHGKGARFEISIPAECWRCLDES